MKTARGLTNVAAEKRWTLRGQDAQGAHTLARALGVSETVARLLVARGVTSEAEARALLTPSLEQLHDPALMLDMDKAVERVLRAVDAGEGDDVAHAG